MSIFPCRTAPGRSAHSAMRASTSPWTAPRSFWAATTAAALQADAAKYQPEDKCYTKILVNGQEPDTRGVRSVNENGRVWGAVLCILERLQTVIPDAFRYDWNAAGGCLTLHSGGHTVTAQVGVVTHLLVDGKENLMDGQPYLTAEGALVMEVNALIPHITGTRTQYDDKVNVLRIETE